MERRQFLKATVGMGALAFLQMAGLGCEKTGSSPTVELPDLPYPNDGLEPYISAKTISFHHGKHHQGYVAKTGTLVAGTPYQNMPLTDIIRGTHGAPGKAAIFNNAAQVFNHNFFWKSMKPNGGGRPSGEVGRLVDGSFGGYEAFRQQFLNAAETQLGSGWVWLVNDAGGLRIVQTSNADTPIATGEVPVLTLDVWEHAYYLDYQNRRADYAKAYLDCLVNWDFAEKNLT
jgi:Fe-Mn family superoxide dismutase